MRSVFVSQLAARLTPRDLGYFFEDKLGELGHILLGSRIFTLVPKGIITSLRSGDYANISHSIGYVEFQKVDLVEKAFQLNGTRRSATGCTQ